jgi:hypothetical protein
MVELLQALFAAQGKTCSLRVEELEHGTQGGTSWCSYLQRCAALRMFGSHALIQGVGRLQQLVQGKQDHTGHI